MALLCAFSSASVFVFLVGLELEDVGEGTAFGVGVEGAAGDITGVDGPGALTTAATSKSITSVSNCLSANSSILTKLRSIFSCTSAREAFVMVTPTLWSGPA